MTRKLLNCIGPDRFVTSSESQHSLEAVMPDRKRARKHLGGAARMDRVRCLLARNVDSVEATLFEPTEVFMAAGCKGHTP
jgi:hypothetical protein